MLEAFGRLKWGLPLTALAIALGGCAGNNPKIWTYDEQTEVAKGAKEDKEIVERSGLSRKTDLSDYVAAVGGKIAAVSDRPTLKWQFTVLDSPAPRAFSTRGGHVYINRGMIALLRSENDLAAVLAHEIAHICTRDTLRREKNENLIGVGMLATIVAEPVTLLAILALPQVTLAPVGAGMAAVSRGYELDADRHGAEYLRRAGYPPESMSAVMAILSSLTAYDRDQQKSGRGKSMWAHPVFADHPDPSKRLRKLGHAALTHGAQEPDPQFLARLDGLEFGSAKWTGIPSGGKRYFAQWDLMLEIPDGWIASATPDKLWLFRKNSRARMSLELTGTSTTIDLCEGLATLAKGAPVTDLHRTSEGSMQACSGLTQRSWIGLVTRDDVPGVRYVFRGFASWPPDNDRVLLSIARSIESLATVEDRPGPTVLKIRRVRDGDSFATLARSVRTANPEADLRVLNHRYPSGEPEVGELVKVIE